MEHPIVAALILGWFISGYAAARLMVWNDRRIGIEPERGYALLCWVMGYVGLFVAAGVAASTGGIGRHERIDAFLRKVLP